LDILKAIDDIYCREFPVIAAAAVRPIHRPPAAGEFLLSLLFHPAKVEEYLGDTEQVFSDFCRRRSVPFAQAWYWMTIIKLVMKAIWDLALGLVLAWSGSQRPPA
jgi:hypothetical protein